MPSCYNPTLLLNLTSKSVSLLQETCAPCATECSTFWHCVEWDYGLEDDAPLKTNAKMNSHFCSSTEAALNWIHLFVLQIVWKFWPRECFLYGPICLLWTSCLCLLLWEAVATTTIVWFCWSKASDIFIYLLILNTGVINFIALFVNFRLWSFAVIRGGPWWFVFLLCVSWVM